MEESYTIEEIGGRTILCDKRGRERWLTVAVPLLNATLQGISAIVKDAEMTPTKELCVAILKRGSEALREQAVADYEAWAYHVAAPKYLQADGERKARESIPYDVARRADGVGQAWSEDCTRYGVMPTDADMTFRHKRLELSDAFINLVAQSFSREVPESFKHIAESFASIVQQLREIEQCGIDAVAMIRHYIGNPYRPESLKDIEPGNVIRYLMVAGKRIATLESLQDDATRLSNAAISMDIERGTIYIK
ncbi:MAG: hypothetical protein MJZ06_04120 [Bacteroidaceae bacterium]|nr:hypothetical protein [Bacteroidaceae bacterium]